MADEDYFQIVGVLLERELKHLDLLVDELFDCIKREGSIWVIGNGGSASTANHFEVDMSFVRQSNQTAFPIRVKSLCSNSALITAIGNDIGFENIFSHQLNRQAKEGDVCLAISASGNSSNLVKAFESCESKGIGKLALLGFNGGKLLELAHVSCLISTETGMYGPVEDVHLSICHFVASKLRTRLFGGRL